MNTKKRTTTIAAMYCPPQHNKKRKYLNVVNHLGNKIIITGIKIPYGGSRLTITKGNELYKAASEI